jgi:Holliday junction resolvasome RuvABC endonuclease subunit
MKILALDVATTTGVCVGSSGAAPRAWTVDLGKSPIQRKLSNALVMTQGLITAHNPDLIVIEAPIGGKKVNQPLIKMVGCIEGCAFNRGVKTLPVNLASVRKHFLGKAFTKQHFPHLTEKAARVEIKNMVIRRCTAIGWNPENDDEADAMALWDWACATQVRSYQAKPLGGLF